MPNPDGTRQVREFAGCFWSEQLPPARMMDLLENHRQIAALYQRLVGPIADEPVVVEAHDATH